MAMRWRWGGRWRESWRERCRDGETVIAARMEIER
jgi:hypothetical protein